MNDKPTHPTTPSEMPLPMQLRALGAILKAGVFDNRNKYHLLLEDAARTLDAQRPTASAPKAEGYEARFFHNQQWSEWIPVSDSYHRKLLRYESGSIELRAAVPGSGLSNCCDNAGTFACNCGKFTAPKVTIQEQDSAGEWRDFACPISPPASAASTAGDKVGGDAPDLFWDDDDPERARESITEVVSDRWENGADNGTVITIQRAIRLPNIDVMLVVIDAENCEYDYEIITPEPAPAQEPRG